MNKYQLMMLAVFMVCCLVCIITSMISLNCVAEKKWDCARASGIVTCVTCVVALFMMFVAFYGKKHGMVG
jgi:membrane protein YdbS with pleckstrin-like domain